MIAWNYEVLKGNINGSFTVEDGKEKAKEYICSLYGADVFNSYTFTYGSIIQRFHKDVVAISYQKFINGYSTGDNICIMFDMKGRMVEFNAYNKGVFDFVNNDIWLQKVQNAETALRLAISEKYHIEDFKSLVFDTNSEKYFLEFVICPKTIPDGLCEADFVTSVYVNID